jgi:hypothetical protein
MIIIVIYFARGGMIDMKIGYSYWGFLGDVKVDADGNLLSTPDGNAFYSWSIIHRLITDGHDVIQIMPDRDRFGHNFLGDGLFKSWCRFAREYAYTEMDKSMYDKDALDTIFGDHKDLIMDYIFKLFDNKKLYDCDVILHEYRMIILGRNDTATMLEDGDWQPDYFIQHCLFRYCAKHNIKLVIFDLDYKISENHMKFVEENDNVYIFELGDKHKDVDRAITVCIPFDFTHMDDFPASGEFPCTSIQFENNLVYIGNRYERDWCIDKYIPTEMNGIMVHGNWTESGRDSKERWPEITFGRRLQTKEMYYTYSRSIATILLAKEDYCKYHFMTARILEAIFYNCVPLFIEEYGEETIKKFAGDYADFLTVRSKADVIDKIYYLKYHTKEREKIIRYLRGYLYQYMDIHLFTEKLYNVVFYGRG